MDEGAAVPAGKSRAVRNRRVKHIWKRRPAPRSCADATTRADGCVAGAAPIEDVRAMLKRAGFVDIEVKVAPRSAQIVGSWMPGIENFVASATIEARKPREGEACCKPGCCS